MGPVVRARHPNTLGECNMKIETTITLKFMGEIKGYTDTVPEKHAIAHEIIPAVTKVAEDLAPELNLLLTNPAKYIVGGITIFTEEMK